MIRIEHSIQIQQPRDRVFDFLTDIDNLPRWQSGVIQSRRLIQGPVRVGYQFEETIKLGPWKLLAVCTVTDLKTNERFSFEMKSKGPLDCDAVIELQPVTGGTRLTLYGAARLKGIWRLLQPVLAGELRKETRGELATMKRLLEGKAPVNVSPAHGAA